MSSLIQGKVVLVTGGTGSIGREIVRQTLEEGASEVRVFSRSEHEQCVLEQELGPDQRVQYFIGDVRDDVRLNRVVNGSQIIFHAAALKHVPVCEKNPYEAVMTNVAGTQNVVEAAIDNGVERVVCISTDKAANAIGVVGATKLLSEKIMVSGMLHNGFHRTIFSSVRLGNILGSRGSVLPLWFDQMRVGSPVVITDPEMTRFVMSVPEAVALAMKAADMALGGEIFVPKMPAVKLPDLASSVIEAYATSFGQMPATVARVTVGRRPGEKTHEILITEEEAMFAVETDDMYIVLPHAGNDARKELKSRFPKSRDVAWKKYDSQTEESMSESEILSTLLAYERDHNFRHKILSAIATSS